MHGNDFVVCIRKVGGKNCREYKIDGIKDHHNERSRIIHIPFHQEYEFVFKNMKNVRRLVSITIDGSEIGDWIIGAGSKKLPNKVVLERFMDSDKRFKVLPLDDDGVDDPDNELNGTIKIVVNDEKEVKPNLGILRSADKWPTTNPPYTLTASTASASFVSNCATGEGSVSNQTFYQTAWNGSEGGFTFEYRINATANPGQIDNIDMSKIREKDHITKKIIEEMDKYKQYSRPPQNFGWVCPLCGRANSPLSTSCPCCFPLKYTITCSSSVKPSSEIV